MKERIHILSNFTVEQINIMTFEDTTLLLKQFNKLKEGVVQIWQLFKLFDTDASDERTLEIMNNHASGRVIKSIEELKKLSASMFSVDKPLVTETATTDMERYKILAENYLEYKKYKTSLEFKEILAESRLQELSVEQDNTACKMQ